MLNPDYNIALFGHAKHGKSTLAGRLLVEYGMIGEKRLIDLQDKVDQIGSKDFNKYNMIFLESKSQTFSKGSGLPDDPSRTAFPERGNIKLAEDKMITLIDTPGYSRYIDNIIYGAYLADAAILVIESSAGIEEGTIIIKRILESFGVPIIAILVTKIDVVGYSELRYDEILEEIDKLLDLKNFKLAQNIPIIPVSAISGEGIKKFDFIKWYNQKPSLMDVLEGMKYVSKSNPKAPVRFTVEGKKEIFSPPGVGLVFVGILESGSLSKKNKLVIEPESNNNKEDITIEIKSIKHAKTVSNLKEFEAVEVVESRAILSIAVTGIDLPRANKIFRRGGVLGLKENKPSVANAISAEVMFFEPESVYQGKEYILYTNCSYSLAKITRTDATNSYQIQYDFKKKIVPVYISSKNDTINVVIEMLHPVCIESDLIFNRLTKFVLKEQNKIVACGRCIKILS